MVPTEEDRALYINTDNPAVELYIEYRPYLLAGQYTGMLEAISGMHAEMIRLWEEHEEPPRTLMIDSVRTGESIATELQDFWTLFRNSSKGTQAIILTVALLHFGPSKGTEILEFIEKWEDVFGEKKTEQVQEECRSILEGENPSSEKVEALYFDFRSEMAHPNITLVRLNGAVLKEESEDE